MKSAGRAQKEFREPISWREECNVGVHPALEALGQQRARTHATCAEAGPGAAEAEVA